LLEKKIQEQKSDSFTIIKKPKLTVGKRTTKTNNSIKIIIADDHEIFREGLCRLLSEQEGIHIISQSTDGQEVIEQAELYNPDVVIMDISMPNIDGIEATSKDKAIFT
jgi:CheY-like chemotaxis protein